LRENHRKEITNIKGIFHEASQSLLSFRVLLDDIINALVIVEGFGKYIAKGYSSIAGIESIIHG
jgi:hypothetical protein